MIEHSDYFVSDDQELLDFDVIHAVLTKSYWSPGIPRDIVERAARNSYCVGVYSKADKAQGGFARLVTDYATFAYLADVFVVDEHKGKGLSKAMMAYIVSRDNLQNLRRWMLATRDAHGLYAQFGFTPVPNPEILMQRNEPDIYQRLAAERS